MAAQGVFAMELRGKVVVNTTKSCAPYFKGNGHHAPTWDLRKAQRTGRGGSSGRQVTRGFPLRHSKHLLPREDVSTDTLPFLLKGRT